MKKIYLLTLVLGVLLDTALALTVTPPQPLFIDGTNGPNKLFLASALKSSFVYSGFPFYNFSDSSTGNDTSLFLEGLGTGTVHVHLFAQSGTNLVAVPMRTSDGIAGTALVGGGLRSANSASGQMNIQINLKLICEYSKAQSTNVDGCDATTGDPILTGGAGSPGVQLSIVTAANEVLASTAGTVGYTLIIVPQNTQPVLSCPASSPKFFPTDGGILVENGQFSATATSGSSPTLVHFVAFASSNATTTVGNVNPALPYSAGIVSSSPWSTGTITLTGFPNSTATSSDFYEVLYGVVDGAGITGFSTVPTTCQDTRVFASDIAGLLKESNCFVATVTYGDRKHFVVRVLRAFRDEVLVHSTMGLKFVSWYYREGPKAALWIRNRPEWIPLAQVLLLPVAGIAYVYSLSPATVPLLLLLLLGFALSYQLGRKHRTLLLLMITFSSLALSVPAQAIESYTAGIKARLESDSASKNQAPPSSYTEEQKKQLNANATSDGYSANLKKKLNAPSDPKDGEYTESIKKNLGPEEKRSAIADFHSQKELKPDFGKDPSRHRFALRFGATERSNLTAGGRQANSYSSVYPSQWAPELNLSYEKKLGSFFSIYSSGGFSYSKGTGVLEVNDSRFGSASRSKVTMVLLPVTLGPMLRLPISRFFTPFVGGGPGALLAYEFRSDGEGSQRGYAFGTWGYAGVEISLDSLSKASKWERYESLGTKELSLSLGYSVFSLIGGGIVEGSISGPQMGFQYSF